MDQPSDAPLVAKAPSENERTWGMLAHLAAFAGLVMPLVGNVLGPLLVWLTKREQSAFVAAHAKEALNFNITVVLAGIVCGFLALIFIGFLLGTALFVAWLVMTLIAAIKASEGVLYHYPVSLRLVK
jgi:uncharacterized Tic20 family protein